VRLEGSSANRALTLLYGFDPFREKGKAGLRLEIVNPATGVPRLLVPAVQVMHPRTTLIYILRVQTTAGTTDDIRFL
jgi:hypothetical protein